ncbi:MAG: flagellar hook capping FlgD N-terminal domain-containing protein [Sulfurimonas sp.]|nr:flagellar hook capping FlgD N-terminal domain-containing protein [Sulfurimonas sp.]
MAITATGENAATATATAAAATAKDKTALGKDDFMKLFLVQLQHQDPTAPMESEQILTQTTQLATIEAADKTNTALTALTASLGSTDQFASVAAIGKRADLGSDSISLDEGKTSSFEMYFPENIASGTIEISDVKGNVVATMDTQQQKDKDGKIRTIKEPGVYQFDWNGKDDKGNSAQSSIYHVNAKYVGSDGEKYTSRVGAYPIESVRFENGKTLVKLGSSYIPLENVKEVY